MNSGEAAERVGGAVECCRKLAGGVYCAATDIRDKIVAVGNGNLSADDALHRLVEDYSNLLDFAEGLRNLADEIETLKGDIPEGK